MNSQTRKNSLNTLLVFFPLLVLSLSPGLTGAQGCHLLLPWAVGIWYAARLEHLLMRWAIIGVLVVTILALGCHDESSLLMSGIALLYVFIWL